MTQVLATFKVVRTNGGDIELIADMQEAPFRTRLIILAALQKTLANELEYMCSGLGAFISAQEFNVDTTKRD